MGINEQSMKSAAEILETRCTECQVELHAINVLSYFPPILGYILATSALQNPEFNEVFAQLIAAGILGTSEGVRFWLQYLLKYGKDWADLKTLQKAVQEMNTKGDSLLAREILSKRPVVKNFCEMNGVDF